jgi:hypothetical protein
VRGAGFRVNGLGFRGESSGIKVQVMKLEVSGSVFRILQCLGFWAE